MFTILTLPVGFETDMMAYVGELFTDLSPAIIVLVGLPLAFWAVNRVVGLIRGGFRTRRT